MKAGLPQLRDRAVLRSAQVLYDRRARQWYLRQHLRARYLSFRFDLPLRGVKGRSQAERRARERWADWQQLAGQAALAALRKLHDKYRRARRVARDEARPGLQVSLELAVCLRQPIGGDPVVVHGPKPTDVFQESLRRKGLGLAGNRIVEAGASLPAGPRLQLDRAKLAACGAAFRSFGW